MSPELVLAGMPLGNTFDVTIRFLKAAESADLIVCESRRVAQTLLKRHSIVRGDDDFAILNEHTGDDELQHLFTRCRQLQRIVLVSDAGMPVFADPGRKLLELAEQTGFRITVLPGASALTVALVRAGINGAFYFAGFAPQESQSRRRFLADLAKRKETVVLYETPYRLKKLVEELSTEFSADEKVFVGIDLSSDNEHIFRFRLKQANTVTGRLPKGAPVLIIDRSESS